MFFWNLDLSLKMSFYIFHKSKGPSDTPINDVLFLKCHINNVFSEDKNLFQRATVGSAGFCKCQRSHMGHIHMAALKVNRRVSFQNQNPPSNSNQKTRILLNQKCNEKKGSWVTMVTICPLIKTGIFIFPLKNKWGLYSTKQLTDLRVFLL